MSKHCLQLSTLLLICLMMFDHVTRRSNALSNNKCEYNNTVYNCSARQLSKIPRGIPTHSTVLDLSANRIEFLGKLDLATMTYLTRIDLSKNAIGKIHELAFAKSARLRDIDLSENRLKSLPRKLFSFVKNAAVINISRNDLDNITEVVLADMNRVKILDLNRNRLTAITWSRLPVSLQYLDIGNNPLLWNASPTATVSGADLPKLRTLIAPNTSITSASVLPQGFFTAFPQLRTLDLSDNGISFVTSEQFRMFKFLRVLKLSGNPIRCACLILPFVAWYRSHQVLRRTESNLPMCSSQGFNLGDATSELLNCPQNKPLALPMVAPQRRIRPTLSYKSKYTLVYDPMMGLYTASALSGMLLLFLLCLLYYRIKKRLLAEWKKWRESIYDIHKKVTKDRVFNQIHGTESLDDVISFKQAPLAKGETYSSLASYRSWRPPLTAGDTISSGGSWRPPYTRAETYSSGCGSWRPPLNKDGKSLESAGARSLAKSETLTSNESYTARPPLRKKCSVCKQPITDENRTISISLGSLSKAPLQRGETISLGSLGKSENQVVRNLPKQYSLGAYNNEKPITLNIYKQQSYTKSDIGTFGAKSPMESRPVDGYTLGVCNQQSFTKSDNGMYGSSASPADRRQRFHRGSTSPLVLCKQKAFINSESSSIESPCKQLPNSSSTTNKSDPFSINSTLGASKQQSFTKSDSIAMSSKQPTHRADEQYLKIEKVPCLKYKRLSFTKSDSMSGVPSRKPAIISSGLFKQQLFVRADSLPLKSCRKQSTLKPDIPAAAGPQPPSIMKTPSKQQSLTDSLGLELGGDGRSLLSVKQGPVQLSVSWDERTFLKNGLDSESGSSCQQQQPLLDRSDRQKRLRFTSSKKPRQQSSSMDSTRQPLLRPQITISDSSGSLDMKLEDPAFCVSDWTPRSLQPSPVTTMVTTPTDDVSESCV